MIGGSWGTVDELVGAVFRLDPGERAGFLYKVEVGEAERAFAERRSALGDPGRCPRCGCARLTRRGRDARGRQRWSCAGCGRSFTADTGGVVSRSRLPAAAWVRFARLFCAAATLRACAAELGVSLKTAWYMRMRVCEMLRLERTVFTTGPGDSVQADEAYRPESLSGNHSNNPGYDPWRPPRRRGGGAREKETLLTLVGSDGSADIRVADAPTVADSARRHLASTVHERTGVACEMHSSLGSAARAMGLEVSRSYSGERRLNLLNSVHSSLDCFLSRFRGVSSRRMQRYMWWFCWAASFAGRGAERERLASLIDLLAVGRYATCRRAMFLEPYAVEARLEVRSRLAASREG